MIKEFLDFLYEQRFEVQTEIDKLEKSNKAPKMKCCENMPNTNEDMAALNVRRLQIQGINKTIEKYLSIKN